MQNKPGNICFALARIPKEAILTFLHQLVSSKSVTSEICIFVGQKNKIWTVLWFFNPVYKNVCFIDIFLI